MKVVRVYNPKIDKWLGHSYWRSEPRWTDKGRLWRTTAGPSYSLRDEIYEKAKAEDWVIIIYDLNNMKLEGELVSAYLERRKARYAAEEARRAESRNWTRVCYSRWNRNAPFNDMEKLCTEKTLINMHSGYKGAPNLGEGLRFKGPRTDWAFSVHNDDVMEFKRRVMNYYAEGGNYQG